jgi:nicotinamide phosphoribosyltransferase
MQVSPILLSDSYKQFHWMMYPKGISKLYSNMTPRSFKHLKTDEAVWFGLQYYIKEYLLSQWNENFFKKPKDEVVKEYKRFHKHFSFYDMPTEHIEKLHDLGYLPIKIKALPEGSLVKEKVPFFTITNTHSDFAWLVNFLETQMSTCIWDLVVVATIAKEYRKILDYWADKTCDDRSFVQWQGHDFSQRGRSSTESTFNQAGHLLSFTGTDTISSVCMLEKYYNANLENELVGSSVPATEHSVASTNILNTAAKIDSVEEEFNEETGEWVIKKILFNNDSFCLL